MDRTFAPVPDHAALEALFTGSHSTPVVVFQHDPMCGISARVYQEMATLAGVVHLVDVTRQHDLVRLIAERTGVRHESPQVLVLCDGQVRWAASHFAITAEAVRHASAAVTPTQHSCPCRAPPGHETVDVLLAAPGPTEASFSHQPSCPAGAPPRHETADVLVAAPGPTEASFSHQA